MQCSQHQSNPEWADKSVKEIMTAVNAERRAARQNADEDEEKMEMETLVQSDQPDTGNAARGNSGNNGNGRGNGNSSGNWPGIASNGNPGRGNNR